MTINLLSTSQLRKIEKAFAHPKTLTDSIILAGVRAEISKLDDARRMGEVYDDEDWTGGIANGESFGKMAEQTIREIIGIA